MLLTTKEKYMVIVMQEAGTSSRLSFSGSWFSTRHRARHTIQRGKMRKMEDIVEMRLAWNEIESTW